MTAEEMLAIKSLSEKGGLSPYEQQMLIEKSAKRPSNAAITGLVLGGGALLVAVGGWIFNGVYANAKAHGNQRAIDILASQALAERNERIAQNPRLVDYINVQTSAGAGSFAGSASNAFSQAEAQIVANALTGRSQMCPQPVSIYSAPQPCGCPGTCG